MQAVRKGEIWLPKRVNLPGTNTVVTPPPRKILVEWICDAIDEQIAEKLAVNPNQNFSNVTTLQKLLRKKLADTTFLLELLSVLDKDHAVFKANYVYQRPRP